MTATLAPAGTPTVRRAVRRSLFWIVVAVFLVAVAAVAFGIRGSGTAGIPFAADNPAPAGSMAIAQVLEQQGVHVVVAKNFDAAEKAAQDRENITIFLYDPQGFLDAEQLGDVTSAVQHVVLLAPMETQLKAVAPQLAPAGAITRSTLTAGCDVAAAAKAGTVNGTGQGYRSLDTDDDRAVGCFGSGDDVYSLMQVGETGGADITVLGTTDALSNEHLPEHGNAALALGLLGQSSTLVWYLPTAADVAGGPGIGELTPPWVSPVMVLLILTAAAAAFWRGRRLGPLVVENLPVTVRANETMEGRARLYQKGAARLHAVDSLRIGTIERLGRLCGLSRLASVDEVIAAVAATTSIDPGEVRSLLLDAVPQTDRDLVRLSDRLLELEAAVARAIRPA